MVKISRRRKRLSRFVECLGGWVCSTLEASARMPVIECFGVTAFNPHAYDLQNVPVRPPTRAERRNYGLVAIGLLLILCFMMFVVAPLNGGEASRPAEKNAASLPRP